MKTLTKEQSAPVKSETAIADDLNSKTPPKVQECTSILKLESCDNMASNKMIPSYQNSMNMILNSNQEIESNPLAIDHISIKMNERMIERLKRDSERNEKRAQKKRLSSLNTSIQTIESKRNIIPLNQLKSQQQISQTQALSPRKDGVEVTDRQNENNHLTVQIDQKELQQLAVEAPTSSLFTDESIRRGFIRKVLVIVGLQLAVTTGFILCSVLNESYREFQKSNSWLMGMCAFFNIFLLIALYCYRESCRRVPINYLLLFAFTACQGYSTSFVCGLAEPSIVLLAGSLTTCLVIGLATYSFCSNTDVTVKISLLIYLPMAVIVVIIVAGSYGSMVSQAIVSVAIIGLFSVYLVFDLQRLTGKKEVTYTLDDYIIAALDIYIDILIIFKELLSLLQQG